MPHRGSLHAQFLKPFGLLYVNFWHHELGKICHLCNDILLKKLELYTPHCIRLCLYKFVVNVYDTIGLWEMDCCLMSPWSTAIVT